MSRAGPKEREARLRAARQAVAEAARVCRELRSSLPELRAELKGDRSPVTIADWASQAVVVLALRDALGPEVVIGEEDARALRGPDQAALRAHVLRAVRRVRPEAAMEDVLDAIDWAGPGSGEDAAEHFWTLDPIDGTKGFLRGEQYAVSLAWVESGKPVVGVLGCPNLSADFARDFAKPDPEGLILSALAGGGARQEPARGAPADARPLALEPRAAGDAMRICQSVEKEHTNRDTTAQVLAQLGIRGRPVQLDSQAKYAVVARRQADAYLRMPTRPGYVERIWDHAAGWLIAREAGARVTDIRGAELDFGRGRGLEANLGVIAAEPRLHARLIRAIDELGLAQAAREKSA
jgi:3'(2'), 5'-bisphosphate nucleotidase